MSFGLAQKGGSLIASMALVHPLHPTDIRSRTKCRNLWVRWFVSSWWPLLPSRGSVLTYIYLSIRMHSLYEICYRTYIYIHKECRSVLVKLHPITFWRTVFVGSAQFLGWMPLLLFFFLLHIVSCSMIYSLILGCLWHLVFALYNILTLGIRRSSIYPLPGYFCTWTFISDATEFVESIFWYYRCCS